MFSSAEPFYLISRLFSLHVFKDLRVDYTRLVRVSAIFSTSGKRQKAGVR